MIYSGIIYLMMKFTNEYVDSFRYGPNLELVVHVSRYKINNTYRLSIDLRKKFKYFKKFGLTKNGLSMSREVALKVHEQILKIPENILMPEGAEYKELARFTKRGDLDVVIGVGVLYKGWGVDIREYVRDELRSYEGFTSRGVRVPVEYVEETAALLMKAVEAYDVLEKALSKRPHITSEPRIVAGEPCNGTNRRKGGSRKER